MPKQSSEYLKKHSGAFYLNYPIPRPLRRHFLTAAGKERTHIVERLHTSKAEANRQKHMRIAVHEREFARLKAAAAGEPTDGELKQARDLRAHYLAASAEERRDIIEHAIDLAERLYPGAQHSEYDEPADPVAYAKAHRFVKVASGRLTLREAFAAQARDAERRRSTDEKYEHALSLFLAYMKVPDAHPEEVSRERALAFVNWLNHDARTAQGKPYAYQTKKNMLGGLSSLWDYLEHQQQVPEATNPWRNHRITGKKKSTDAPDPYDELPFDDTDILNLCHGPELRGSQQTRYPKRTLLEVLTLAFYTGMRLDEICSRKVGEVEERGEGYVWKVTRGKRASSIRDLPIVHPIPVAIIARRMKGRTNTEEQVFPEFRPGGYDQKAAKPAVKALMHYRRKCGLSTATDTHSTRRTFITRAEASGAHPVWLERYNGHKPTGETSGRYAVGVEESKREIAKLIAYPEHVEAAFRVALGLT
jgi:integrase